MGSPQKTPATAKKTSLIRMSLGSRSAMAVAAQTYPARKMRIRTDPTKLLRRGGMSGPISRLTAFVTRGWVRTQEAFDRSD